MINSVGGPQRPAGWQLRVGRWRCRSIPVASWPRTARTQATYKQYAVSGISTHPKKGTQPPPRRIPDQSRAHQARSDKGWERGYAAAQEFSRVHGHLRVPRRYQSDGLRLDAWLGRQRAAFRDGRLPAD
ncbi:helicase associated domain-containing protein [Streptomyces sp. NPDC048389]|uniref:helicase associated domain-containing protein n=1 Tax=Streptomyces sp. NPDC048389 TaxID=3154622 RepID=UPI0034543E68